MATLKDIAIEAGVSLGSGFQRVEEIVDDFIKGQLIMNVHPGGIQILHVPEHAPPLLAQLHDVAT